MEIEGRSRAKRSIFPTISLVVVGVGNAGRDGVVFLEGVTILMVFNHYIYRLIWATSSARAARRPPSSISLSIPMLSICK